MSLRGNRGFSLIGVLVAASIGLALILLVARVVTNFSEKSVRLNRLSELGIFERNLTSLLKSVDGWDATLKKTGGKIPGVNTAIVLYREGSNRPIMCRKKGGRLNEGVIIFKRNGEVQSVDCGRCRSDENCGFSKKEYSRVEVTSAGKPGLRPDYTGSILDTSGIKTVKPYTSSAGQELYDEMQVSCKPNEFLVMVQNGEPVCLPEDIALRGKTCPRGNVLIGFNSNGQPRCNPLSTLIRPFIDNRNSRRFVTNNLLPRTQEIDKTMRNFNTKYRSMGLYGRETEVRGSNFTECALLRRMACPDGHFMTSYEALQPSAGGNCSIHCKEFVVK